MNRIEINRNEFKTLQKIIYEEVGITLDCDKRVLLQSRLIRRLLHYKLNSFLDYIRLVQINHKDKIEMINLVTTNETYFFRENLHFEFLKSVVASFKESEFRVWSAASSVGAEAYSIAMIVDELLKYSKWEIVATDVNHEVIKKARVGLYPISWADKIPDNYKKRYCLKGKGKYEGQFLIDRELAKRINFDTNNLLYPNRKIGVFDIVFLRNVLIYFSDEIKQRVIDNVLMNIKTGGYLIISLTENLNALSIPSLKSIGNSIYKKEY